MPPEPDDEVRAAGEFVDEGGVAEDCAVIQVVLALPEPSLESKFARRNRQLSIDRLEVSEPEKGFLASRIDDRGRHRQMKDAAHDVRR